jgi:hypothetical protein
LKHGKDIQAAGSAILLDVDERQFLGRLPVGVAIVKLQNRWYMPFMLKIPYSQIGYGEVTDEVLSRMAGYFAKQGVISPEKGRRRDIPPVSDVDKEAKTLLVSIADHPFLGIAERYRKIELNPRKGNQCKLELIRQGLIREVSITMQRGRMKLLDLTEKGREELKKLGLTPPKPANLGGTEHRYWVDRVRSKIESAGHEVVTEYITESGDRVDLAIMGRKKIAVEVETGKSDVLKNIRKSLSAGFGGVVMLATSHQALKEIRAKLGKLDPEDRKKVRTGMARVE